MVALLGLFDQPQMLFERFDARERSPVDALKHRISLVAPPVRARHVRQSDRFEIPGRRDMRPLAHVDPFLRRRAVLVEAHFLVGRDGVDDLELVGLAHRREHPLRFVARHDHPAKRRILLYHLEHRLLDATKVVVGETAAGLVEIVIKPLVDGGADGDLRAGEKALNRVGHHVSGRVSDDRETLGIGGADGPEHAAGVDRRVKVDGFVAVFDRDDVLFQFSVGRENLSWGLSFRHRQHRPYSPRATEVLWAGGRRTPRVQRPPICARP